MSEVNNVNTYEDEIDLRELIMTLWRGKYIILSIALIAAILTGLYSMFMLPPVYQTRLDIVVNMPEQYRTRYGDYKLPITSNEQYIDLITSNRVLLNTIKNLGANGKSISVEGLRNRISIKKGSDPSKQNTLQYWSQQIILRNPCLLHKTCLTIILNLLTSWSGTGLLSITIISLALTFNI